MIIMVGSVGRSPKANETKKPQSENRIDKTTVMTIDNQIERKIDMEINAGIKRALIVT